MTFKISQASLCHCPGTIIVICLAQLAAHLRRQFTGLFFIRTTVTMILGDLWDYGDSGFKTEKSAYIFNTYGCTWVISGFSP